MSMTELPVLIIGCENVYGIYPAAYVCGGIANHLCPTCSHNKQAVLAHAAAHQKDEKQLLAAGGDCLLCDEERMAGLGAELCSDHAYIQREYRSARDAVMELIKRKEEGIKDV